MEDTGVHDLVRNAWEMIEEPVSETIEREITLPDYVYPVTLRRSGDYLHVKLHTQDESKLHKTFGFRPESSEDDPKLYLGFQFQYDYGNFANYTIKREVLIMHLISIVE